MKRHNKLILLLFVAMIFSAMSVLGTSTFVTPGASATITGSTYVVNVTSDLANLQNCSVTAASTLTSDSLSTTWLTNISAASSCNATIDTTALEDATDWAFDGTCYNTTGSSESITQRASVTVDNTVPVAPSSPTPGTGTEDNDGDQSQTFSVTVTGARTTACTLYFVGDNDPGAVSYTMTHSGNTCTYAATNVPSFLYEWLVEASDGTNRTNSSTWVWEEKYGAFGKRRTPSDSDDGKGKPNAIVILAIVAGVAYFMTQGKGKKKGKKRRRK